METPLLTALIAGIVALLVSVITNVVQGRRAREEREFTLKREELADARKLRDERIRRLMNHYTAVISVLMKLDIRLEQMIQEGKPPSPEEYRQILQQFSDAVAPFEIEPSVPEDFNQKANNAVNTITQQYVKLLDPNQSDPVEAMNTAALESTPVGAALADVIQSAKDHMRTLETTDVSTFLLKSDQ